MDIEKIRELCANNALFITEHIKERMKERHIKASAIREAIMTGKIIEDYPEAYPHPACLILRSIFRGRPLHVVVGANDKTLYLITAYYPDPAKWDRTFERRKSHGED